MSSLTRSRRRLTAWLGLVAVWLLVLMPLASQLAEAAAAHRPDAPICTSTQPAGGHGGPRHDALSACGYCTLAASHACAPPGAPRLTSLPALVRRAPALARTATPRPFPTLAALARAPPALG